jgi:hypothetical protein
VEAGSSWDRWNRDQDWDRGDRARNWERSSRDRNWDRRERRRNNNNVNVVNIDERTARVWQPSVRIQRAHRQRRHCYDAATASNRYAHAERRRSPGADRRFAAVVKPTRSQLSGRFGNGNRQISRSENADLRASARTARRELRRPTSDAPILSRRMQRWRDQAARSGRGNVACEWKEKGQGGRGSRGMVRERAEAPSIHQPNWQVDQSHTRERRSVKRRASSANDQALSERPRQSYSKPGKSRQQLRARELDFSCSSRAFSSKAKKSSQGRAARPQAHSQRSLVSHAKPDQPARVHRQRSQARPKRSDARVERSGGGSRRSTEAYSKPHRPQAPAASNKKEGGGHKSGKKRGKNND